MRGLLRRLSVRLVHGARGVAVSVPVVVTACGPNTAANTSQANVGCDELSACCSTLPVSGDPMACLTVAMEGTASACSESLATYRVAGYCLGDGAAADASGVECGEAVPPSVSFRATGSCGCWGDAGAGGPGLLTISAPSKSCDLDVTDSTCVVGSGSRGQFTKMASETGYDLRQGNWSLSVMKNSQGNILNETCSTSLQSNDAIELACSIMLCSSGECSEAQCSETLNPM
jgi:hypothetical protein